MKKFLLKIFIFSFILLSVCVFIIVSLPYDRNNYICEYSHKVELLEKTLQPRVVFIGGSNVAFGLDSKTISDSLNINVINFGLHGGIGARFITEDCYNLVKDGDIVVFQIEYENLYDGGYGSGEALSYLMFANNWRNFFHLYPKQYIYIYIYKNYSYCCFKNKKIVQV